MATIDRFDSEDTMSMGSVWSTISNRWIKWNRVRGYTAGLMICGRWTEFPMPRLRSIKYLARMGAIWIKVSLGSTVLGQFDGRGNWHDFSGRGDISHRGFIERNEIGKDDPDDRIVLSPDTQASKLVVRDGKVIGEEGDIGPYLEPGLGLW